MRKPITIKDFDSELWDSFKEHIKTKGIRLLQAVETAINDFIRKGNNENQNQDLQ